MRDFSTPVARMATGMTGLAVGFYCAYTAFRNGQMMATGFDGIVFGAAFAAVVVGSWFLLPLASHSPATRKLIFRAGWSMCLVFVLVNAIGFTATHRTDRVGDRQNSIASYDAAQTGLTQARERLAAMKGNRRWESTSGCTDATVAESIAFCDDFRATQAKADKFQATVSAGKPATADAQADTIGWVIRTDAATVSRALPIFLAIVLDIVASLFMFAAFASYSRPVEQKATEPKPKAKRKAKARPKAKLTKSPTLAKHFGDNGTVKLTKSGRTDFRTREGRRLKRAAYETETV